MAFENGAQSAETSNKVVETITKLPPVQQVVKKVPNFESLVRKVIGHFSLYAFLGLFSFLTYHSFIKNESFATSINLSSGFLISFLTEVIQVFATSRGPSFQDVIINFQGFLLTQLLIITIIFLFIIKDFKSFSIWKLPIILTNISSIFIIVLFLIFAEKTFELLACNWTLVIFLCLTFIVNLIMYLIKKKKIRE